ncbi:unnamed protein product [Trifolium pratense]|uniref:Uncharacterized protein n=1 Tax=Trifolium pratense TaxID=57577 RepID=A0ACB0LZJ2_TRIPR|nr:unnamed protein product [Trifolium pratense]
MVLDGFTSTERAVVVNIGTHMNRKILGTRDSLILVSFTALKTRFSLGKLKSLLKDKSLNLSKPCENIRTLIILQHLEYIC